MESISTARLRYTLQPGKDTWQQSKQSSNVQKEWIKEERERGVEWAKEILRMVNENGDTALHEAVMNPRQLDVVKVLVREEDAEHLYEGNKGGRGC